MLNEEYILKVIKYELEVFKMKYGREPNVVRIGIEILNILKAYNAKEISFTYEPNTLYGIPISINSTEPLAFEIGLIKKLNLDIEV